MDQKRYLHGTTPCLTPARCARSTVWWEDCKLPVSWPKGRHVQQQFLPGVVMACRKDKHCGRHFRVDSLVSVESVQSPPPPNGVALREGSLKRQLPASFCTPLGGLEDHEITRHLCRKGQEKCKVSTVRLRLWEEKTLAQKLVKKQALEKAS